MTAEHAPIVAIATVEFSLSQALYLGISARVAALILEASFDQLGEAVNIEDDEFPPSLLQQPVA